MIDLRAFPILYTASPQLAALFYEKLGFERRFQFPAEGEPDYIALCRGQSEMAVVDRQWPTDHYGVKVGESPRSEMFIYVDNVDATFRDLSEGGATVLRPPTEMPWGERVGFILDPDGNPVALAAPPVETAPIP